MQFIYRLLKLGFLNPFTIYFLIKAQRTHGSNLSFLLKFASDKFGDKIALTDGNIHIKFNELYKKVTQLSFIVHKIVKPNKDDVALFFCKNNIEHTIFLFALQNMSFKTILIHHKIGTNDITKIIEAQKTSYHIFASDFYKPNFWNIDELVAKINDNDVSTLISKNVGNIIFPTSGTTGTPKLIEKRKGSFYWLYTFIDLITRTKIQAQKSDYISIPISHGFGYTALLFGLILGKKTMLNETKDKSELANLLVQENIDVLVGVPASLFSLAESLKEKKHNIKLVICGGAPLNEIIFKSVTSHLTKNIFSMYGSTEGSTSFIANFDDLNKNIHSLGKPLKGIKYKLFFLDNQNYELCIDSKLANVVAKDGWVYTGDLVKEDKENGLVWCGRKDDMILKNGVNIYPIEIENEFLRIDGIEDVFVLGEKDTIKGEILVAFITTKLNTALSEDAIKSILKEKLSPVKIPEKIHKIDKFQYTSTGKKIKKFLLF